MTITVPKRPVGHAVSTTNLRYALDAAELVDSYCVDYLTADNVIDRQYLAQERVDHVQRTLAELRAVISRGATGLGGLPSTIVDSHSDTVRRAVMLADAIIEGLGLNS